MKKHRVFFLAAAAGAVLCLCQGPQSQAWAQVRTPQAAGTAVYGNGIAVLDASNTGEGYCMIRYTGGVPKIKVQISNGAVIYTYDLNARNAYEVFPFSEGNGSYSVKVFEQVSGNQYSQVMSQNVNVSLKDEFSPFLYPNQYVNFTENSAAVSLAQQVTSGAVDEIGKVKAVYEYVVGNMNYDYAKAQSVQSGYLPNVDQVLASKTGICFDYAAVMTAMLRSQDIPTKLVVGYTGDVYHAWVDVYIKEMGWVDNFIYFDGVSWKLMDPTFASSGGNTDAVKQYIGDGANYRSKYSY